MPLVHTVSSSTVAVKPLAGHWMEKEQKPYLRSDEFPKSTLIESFLASDSNLTHQPWQVHTSRRITTNLVILSSYDSTSTLQNYRSKTSMNPPLHLSR